MFYGFLGVVLGGRIGYVLFYQFDVLISNPLYALKIWDGGMSFHGGLGGVVLAFWYFSRKSGKPLMALADFIAPFCPIGLGAGRIGNFINAELYGRVTDLESTPWAVHFPDQPAGVYRHPSQIYEFLLEGILLFIIVFWFSQKPRPRMAVAGLFGMLYGVFRFFVEYFREPDEHLAEMAQWLTMGQVLSIPLIVIGGGCILWAYKYPKFDTANIQSKSQKIKKTRRKK